MPRRLAFIDEPAPKERHKAAVPGGVVFAQASIPAVDSEVREIWIGTPDPNAKRKCYRDWAEVKRKYEAERDDPNGSVTPDLKIHVVEEMDPEEEGVEPQDSLQELVGTRQANALLDAGYGTVEAARALPKEDLVAIKGVGGGTYDKLHADED